jgi:hypothetical protein
MLWQGISVTDGVFDEQQVGSVLETRKPIQKDYTISITRASLRSAAQPSKYLYFRESEAGEFDSDEIDAGDSDDEASEHWDTDEDEDEADHIIL